MADVTEIREDTDKDRWVSLMSLWEHEHRPGWIVVGNKTYMVLRLESGVTFRETQGDKSFYESTSF